jgi:hypothetical protein
MKWLMTAVGLALLSAASVLSLWYHSQNQERQECLEGMKEGCAEAYLRAELSAYLNGHKDRLDEETMARVISHFVKVQDAFEVSKLTALKGRFHGGRTLLRLAERKHWKELAQLIEEKKLVLHRDLKPKLFALATMQREWEQARRWGFESVRNEDHIDYRPLVIELWRTDAGKRTAIELVKLDRTGTRFNLASLVTLPNFGRTTLEDVQHSERKCPLLSPSTTMKLEGEDDGSFGFKYSYEYNPQNGDERERKARIGDLLDANIDAIREGLAAGIKFLEAEQGLQKAVSSAAIATLLRHSGDEERSKTYVDAAFRSLGEGVQSPGKPIELLSVHPTLFRIAFFASAAGSWSHIASLLPDIHDDFVRAQIGECALGGLIRYRSPAEIVDALHALEKIEDAIWAERLLNIVENGNFDGDRTPFCPTLSSSESCEGIARLLKTAISETKNDNEDAAEKALREAMSLIRHAKVWSGRWPLLVAGEAAVSDVEAAENRLTTEIWHERSSALRELVRRMFKVQLALRVDIAEMHRVGGLLTLTDWIALCKAAVLRGDDGSVQQACAGMGESSDEPNTDSSSHVERFSSTKDRVQKLAERSDWKNSLAAARTVFDRERRDELIIDIADLAAARHELHALKGLFEEVSSKAAAIVLWVIWIDALKSGKRGV